MLFYFVQPTNQALIGCFRTCAEGVMRSTSSSCLRNQHAKPESCSGQEGWSIFDWFQIRQGEDKAVSIVEGYTVRTNSVHWLGCQNSRIVCTARSMLASVHWSSEWIWAANSIEGTQFIEWMARHARMNLTGICKSRWSVVSA